MADITTEYLLFLAKAVTAVGALLAVVVLGARAARQGREPERLVVRNLNRRYRRLAAALRRHVLPRKTFLRFTRAEKAREKQDKDHRAARKRVFVLDFRGDIRASAVASLREEITAVLTLARPEDEVLLRLDNAGGLVHEHGLAASQLQRIRARGIPLTVAVDKVAASGGYMMACVADRILAAPFAIIGSIGVLAQLPNLHRWLDQHGIDFELIKAGELKRTLTVFGENTEVERAYMQEQIDDTHALFKEFVAAHRPQVDIDQTANGRYWFASRAVGLNLVDEIVTSDDYLLAASDRADLFEVHFTARKPRHPLASVRRILESVPWRDR